MSTHKENGCGEVKMATWTVEESPLQDLSALKHNCTVVVVVAVPSWLSILVATRDCRETIVASS